MLDYKVLELDHGVSYGSVTLKSLQNDYVPELDLLVREAIQNSSDASLLESDESFKVNFSTGFFVPKNFNSFMTGLESILNKFFPSDTADFLEIRDTKTSGLTGHIHKADINDDDHGNFFKLIFDTGKKQTISGAGGNWGFGKSVYYRVGIGIVVFYSRVKIEEEYESRLIITLVEDESKKNSDGSHATFLHELNPRSVGKAWWGIKDGEDFLPITDQEFIDAVLNVFGINPFKNNETGTSIIIPYIDRQKLLDDIVPHEVGVSDDVKQNFVSVWGSSIEDYLQLSIQKWYAPKIHNRDLLTLCDDKKCKKWLNVSVNNKPIRKQDMLPFFRLVQELYTLAFAKTRQTEYLPELDYEISTRAINVLNYFSGGKTAGYVAIAKVTKHQLYGEGNYLSPYVYCGHFEADGGKNEPLVMYARDPGMVIEYAISGLWVKNIPWPDSEDDFIFAFFVPDTRKLLKADLEIKEHAGKELGDYLRSCEASDHMGWSDPAKMSLVARIQRNTVEQITKLQNVDIEKSIDAAASRLSGKLGKLLMPRIGYAKGKGGPGGGESGGGAKLRNLTFDILSQKLAGGELELEYKIKLSHGKRTAEISVVVDSEGGRIDPLSWQRDIGTPYPATILEAVIDNVNSPGLGKTEAIGASCTRERTDYSDEYIEAYLSKADGSAEYATFSVKSHIIGAEIIGKLRIHARDKRYSFSFKVV